MIQSEAQTAATVWSADSVVVREGSVFSFGWCARAGALVTESWLEVRYAGGQSDTVPVQYGGHRPDVQTHFPSLTAQCGFFVFFAFRDPLQMEWMSIHFKFEDGHLASYKLPVSQALTGNLERTGLREHVAALGNDAKRALEMMMRGQSGALLEAFRRRKTLLGAKHGNSRALQSAINALNPGAVMVVDHALGGGANKFSAELIDKKLNIQKDVVVWTFMPSLLRFQVSLWAASSRQETKFHVSWDAHLQILASKKISEIAFNNAVSFTQPLRVPSLLQAAKNVCGAEITVYLHDFYTVCPSHFLMNDTGAFCGVPSIEKCRNCLPKINDGFVSLHQSRDIDDWRARWGATLARADQIVCFSESSARLLLRAYPELLMDRIKISPHQVVRPPGRHVPRPAKSALRVAIVGHISWHKGSQVVVGLAAAARKHQIPIEVVVIGTLMGAAGAGHIIQTGSYEAEKLAALLNLYEIDMALMPSICAETFSYVTHELIHLNLPVVCFDLGAQAEAVQDYPLGKVLPICDGQTLLLELQRFASDLGLLMPDHTEQSAKHA